MKKIMFIYQYPLVLIAGLGLILLSACATPPAPASVEPSPLPTATEPIPPDTVDGAPLVFVPAGEFTMGSDLEPNEQPIHKVTLDAFWIDKYETTNALYRKCVEAQVCKAPPGGYTGRHVDGYYSNPEFDNFPVGYVGWNEADQYCRWAGKRLPTEAEWEKAARGTDARPFPWGDTFDGERANSALRNELITTAVGHYPNGASPYGAEDMSGNVWEWVADWYDEDYYAESPKINPSGPSTGEMKILRGGGYGGYDAALRTSIRRESPTYESTPYIGFRCAWSSPS